jgi:hypothetical protein
VVSNDAGSLRCCSFCLLDFFFFFLFGLTSVSYLHPIVIDAVVGSEMGSVPRSLIG